MPLNIISYAVNIIAFTVPHPERFMSRAQKHGLGHSLFYCSGKGVTVGFSCVTMILFTGNLTGPLCHSLIAVSLHLALTLVYTKISLDIYNLQLYKLHVGWAASFRNTMPYSSMNTAIVLWKCHSLRLIDAVYLSLSFEKNNLIL